MLHGILALVFLLLTVTMLLVIVTQRRNIGDTRSRASYGGAIRAPSVKPKTSLTIAPKQQISCRGDDSNACGGHPERCHCLDGDLCTKTACENPSVKQSCLNQGRSWCVNYQGFAFTCCAAGYTCGPGGVGCYRAK